MMPRTREILSTCPDWFDVYQSCLSAERAHRLESARLFPQWSRFEDCLTDTERAWFRGGMRA